MLPLVAGALVHSSALADTFGSGANAFEIEFVTIGQPGNAADTTGDPNPARAVPYEYRIGKYEISEQMIDKANALGGLGITKDTRGPDKPATSMSWFEAARFVNWLNTSSGSMPAYKFDQNDEFQLWIAGDAGYNSANRFRNAHARYFLPSADEWYKAAFYDPTTGGYWDYPTGSNMAPLSVPFGNVQGTAVWNRSHEEGPADVMFAGGMSPYGTSGQAGNVWEWEETESDLVNDTPNAPRGVRGSDWNPSVDAVGLSSTYRTVIFPSTGNPTNGGFRIGAVIPEPESVRLAILIVLPAALTMRRRRKPCWTQLDVPAHSCGVHAVYLLLSSNNRASRKGLRDVHSHSKHESWL